MRDLEGNACAYPRTFCLVLLDGYGIVRADVPFIRGRNPVLNKCNFEVISGELNKKGSFLLVRGGLFLWTNNFRNVLMVLFMMGPFGPSWAQHLRGPSRLLRAVTLVNW